MNINILALILTETCTANCKICFSECSPEKKGHIDLNPVFSYIESSKEFNTIFGVGITGGEPFLFFDELLKIIKKCREQNLWVTCTTNGFWGITEKKALNIVSKLKKFGLTELHLSCDDFHNEFVPYKNIKNILYACKKIYLPVEIRCISTKKSQRLKGIIENLVYEDINKVPLNIVHIILK
jgi:MoaA/NifB/PqqE/SkfB family radical SAM enzyme